MSETTIKTDGDEFRGASFSDDFDDFEQASWVDKV